MANKAKRNREAKNSRDWYREHGICYNCRTRDARPGHALCQICTDKIYASRRKRDPDGSKSRAYFAERRARFKVLGICIDCRAPTDGVHTRCKTCMREGREAQQVRRIRARLRKEKQA